MMALERFKVKSGLSPNQLILFANIARTRFLVEKAFELLAEEKFQSTVWRSYRDYVKGNLTIVRASIGGVYFPQRFRPPLRPI